METHSALGTNWHSYTQESHRCSQQMEIDGCNLQEEDASCTKAPLLPTPCGVTINLMCLISTIQGCKPLLEKEVKNPQCAIAEGSRERGWQFLSVHRMKIRPLSSSEVNMWVLAGHAYVSVPTATSCGSLSAWCSISAGGFYNAGSHKGRRTILEMTFSVASKVYFEELHFHWNTVQLSAKSVLRDTNIMKSDGWCYAGSAACYIQLHEQAEHTHVPHGQHCQFRGFRAAFVSLTFWKRQNQGN